MTMLYVYRFLYIKDVIYVCIIYIHTHKSHPTRSPPHPYQGSPGVKWRHLEGDNLSAARAQGPNDLMANGICGAPVEKTKLGPPTLVASAPFSGATELLGSSA